MKVQECFYSLQGEGAEAGMPALFVRLAGCNQHCEFCDSKETWNEKNGMEFDTGKSLGLFIARRMIKDDIKDVIITGGEPLMHIRKGLEECLSVISSYGRNIHIETSGFSGQNFCDYFFPFSTTCIHLSPKLKKNAPEPFFIGKAEEIRFPVENEEDLCEVRSWISRNKSNIRNKTKIYISPVIKEEDNMRMYPETDFFKKVIQFCKDEKYRLSLQQHKWWGIK